MTCFNCIHRGVCENWANDIYEETCIECAIQRCDLYKGKSDVIEVVRCAECKSCIKFYPAKMINEEAELVYYCRLFKGDRRPNDYCSFGIRKEGNNNG